MNFSIRQATEQDFSGLNDLFEEIDAYHRNALPHVFRKPDGPARTKEFLSGVLADQNAVIFIGESEGKIIGLVYAYVRSVQETPIRIPSRVGEVDHIVVKQAYRRCGVGRALMERIHQWAAQMKVNRLELSVWNFNNEAQDFYRGLGYGPAFIRMWKAHSGS